MSPLFSYSQNTKSHMMAYQEEIESYYYYLENWTGKVWDSWDITWNDEQGWGRVKNKEINKEQSASSFLPHLIWGYPTGKKSKDSLLEKLKSSKEKDLTYGCWMGEGRHLSTKEPSSQPSPTNEAQWTTNFTFAQRASKEHLSAFS